MSEADDYRCFVWSLSWSTTDVDLKDAFGKFGRVTESKVVLDKFSGRSRGFGFVTFDDKKAMEEAVEGMNGIDLDGRNITGLPNVPIWICLVTGSLGVSVDCVISVRVIFGIHVLCCSDDRSHVMVLACIASLVVFIGIMVSVSRMLKNGTKFKNGSN